MSLTKIYLRALLKSEGKANKGLVLIFILIFAQVALMRELNFWNKNFYDSLQNLDQARFIKELFNFLILAGLYFVIFKNLKLFLTNSIQIRWRKELTNHFTQLWIKHKKFLSLDHPEQRITEDINELTALSLEFTIKIISEATLIILFSQILYKISPELFYLNVLLFIFSLFSALWIGAPLAQINYDQQQKESSFRYLMTFFRVHHFDIQKSTSPQNVEREIKIHFRDIESNFNLKNIKTVFYEIYLNIYQQLCYIIPFFKMAPLVFQKSATLGDLFQSTSAFAQVNASSNYFIESYSLISRWVSVHKRLREFHLSTLLEDSKPGTDRPEDPNHALKIHQLTILNSDQKKLKEISGCTLNKGQALLIMGPNGSGKSTFINTVMGFWSEFHGEFKSDFKKTLFISSESLLKSPTSLNNYFQFFGVSDENLIKNKLDHYNLGFLKSVDFNKSLDWSQLLSQGQKQKLKFMLTTLLSHDTLILDEALSFLPPQEELKLISDYIKESPQQTLIVISHNEALGSLIKNQLSF